MPSLFEIILDPEGKLSEKKQEPTLFDLVLRPEKFISQISAEEREEPELDEKRQNPIDFNQFRYEFSTTPSTTSTTTAKRCLKRGHVANYKLFVPSLSFSQCINLLKSTLVLNIIWSLLSINKYT